MSNLLFKKKNIYETIVNVFLFWFVYQFQTNCVTPYSAYYEGHLESKERFAIQRYLLIIGKKQNMQVLSHTFTYFST